MTKIVSARQTDLSKSAFSLAEMVKAAVMLLKRPERVFGFKNG
jgi:hypothetical protein